MTNVSHWIQSWHYQHPLYHPAMKIILPLWDDGSYWASVCKEKKICEIQLFSLLFYRGVSKKCSSIFSKFSFLFHLKNHHSKDVNLNFGWNDWAIWMCKAILYIAIAYILLCKVNLVTITRHIFINTKAPAAALCSVALAIFDDLTHFYAIALWMTPYYPCMTFKPSDALHSGLGFFYQI